MKVITSLKDIKIDCDHTGVALGNFDGMHTGHKTLIVNLVEICKKNGFKSVVYTFKNHPRKLTTENRAPRKIISTEEKFRFLAELGVDYVVCVEFDEYQMNLPAEDFIKDILKEKLKMSYVVVGFNYRFGYKAQGNTKFFNDLKEKYKYDLMVIDAIKIQDEVISSTKIREIVQTGNINKANLFLGRNYSIIGRVVHGKKLGKKFGFPTANIKIDKSFVLPSSGVYFTKSIVGNRIYESITNIGHNPTIGENPMSIETHILDFDGELYEKDIQVLFYQKSREEKKHETINDLIHQVKKDIQLAKKFFYK